MARAVVKVAWQNLVCILWLDHHLEECSRAWQARSACISWIQKRACCMATLLIAQDSSWTHWRLLMLHTGGHHHRGVTWCFPSDHMSDMPCLTWVAQHWLCNCTAGCLQSLSSVRDCTAFFWNTSTDLTEAICRTKVSQYYSAAAALLQSRVLLILLYPLLDGRVG
jgi:hypothetical protein